MPLSVLSHVASLIFSPGLPFPPTELPCSAGDNAAAKCNDVGSPLVFIFSLIALLIVGLAFILAPRISCRRAR